MVPFRFLLYTLDPDSLSPARLRVLSFLRSPECIDASVRAVAWMTSGLVIVTLSFFVLQHAGYLASAKPTAFTKPWGLMVAVVVSLLYASPNLFGEVPAVQVSGTRAEQKVDETGLVVSDEDVTPARIFDDFLNGHYFHEDEDRISRIGDWIPSELQRFIFVGTFHNLAGVYTRFAGTPVAILRELVLRS